MNIYIYIYGLYYFFTYIYSMTYIGPLAQHVRQGPHPETEELSSEAG